MRERGAGEKTQQPPITFISSFHLLLVRNFVWGWRWRGDLEHHRTAAANPTRQCGEWQVHRDINCLFQQAKWAVPDTEKACKRIGGLGHSRVCKPSQVEVVPPLVFPACLGIALSEDASLWPQVVTSQDDLRAEVLEARRTAISRNHISTPFVTGKTGHRSRPPLSGGMKALQLLLPVVVCVVVKVYGKIISRCELALILKRWGMDRRQGYSLADWVCLAYYASGFNTATVMHNADGTSEYGIFQLNSRSWCADNHSESRNLCSMPCNDLLTNDIEDDVACLQKAAAREGGLEAWYGWRNHCRGRNLSHWVAPCNL
ncbi:hypothetical protein JRQ81_003702 [Phrynocephalus forsythii]|uniref:lysozyme n=1 Tax=Phrynocephalus forsythii TaxID=171643 RepID=A0A9Q0XLC0_9SAUR|nr:hypothetical protein JRQ81_003702 [Phrynocephalus forsythii]